MILEDLKIKRDESFSVSQQIVDYFQENIRSNRFKAGQKLPKASELARDAGVGNHTLKDAMSILKEMGLVRTIPGKGTFVVYSVDDADLSQGAVKARNVAVFSTFKQNCSAPKTSHPQTVDSILSALWEIGSRGYLVSPYVNLDNYDEVAGELKSGGFDGAIWLYPQDSHWQVIEKLREDGTNIVATTHYGNNYDIPAVQGNGAVSAAMICDYMVSNGVKKIFVFWNTISPDFESNKAITTTGHIGFRIGFTIVLQTRGLVDSVEVKDVVFRDEADMYKFFKDNIQDSPVKTGVMAPINELFYSHFVNNPQDFQAVFANCRLVIGTSEVQNNLLEPLSKIGEFKTLLSPLQSIGKSSVHKLMNILDGKFENNATMVPDIFGDFKII
jgi:DNA-binding transcriptional regulator YhcF (GntR family)